VALNILIIDDSSVMRSMIMKTLQMSGVPVQEIFQAANGQEGLSILQAQWVDLVLADINMPVMGGEEMIDRVREISELKDTPIVVISTEGSQTRIDRLKGKGVEFVHKPFSPEVIRNTIKKLMGEGVFNDTKG
jgi:two-component system, chemotaxis family, chemotaxis protein CheY